MDLKSELTALYPYKIEAHAHTRPASPCSEMTPEMLIARYAAEGFDGVVLTNHFAEYLIHSDQPQEVADTYLRDYYEAKNLGAKHGMRVYLGMEVRFVDAPNDYLVYGVGEEDIKQVFSYIHGDYVTFYRAFKNEKNVIVQAHPFRDRMVRQDDRYLDGMEVFNVHLGHNSRNGLANQYAHRRDHFIKTCGSDFHEEGNQGLGAMRMKTLPEDSFGIAEILKSGDYLFDLSGSIILP